jgi:putative redox protein
MREVSVSTAGGKFKQTVRIGPHELVSDEPVKSGGSDQGPAPHELLLAALGSCTSMTVRMYAERKAWPLGRVEVSVSAAREDERFRIRRRIHLEGELSDEQRERLLEIANKCPVHRTLSGTIQIESVLI